MGSTGQQPHHHTSLSQVHHHHMDRSTRLLFWKTKDRSRPSHLVPSRSSSSSSLFVSLFKRKSSAKPKEKHSVMNPDAIPRRSLTQRSCPPQTWTRNPSSLHSSARNSRSLKVRSLNIVQARPTLRYTDPCDVIPSPGPSNPERMWSSVHSSLKIAEIADELNPQELRKLIERADRRTQLRGLTNVSVQTDLSFPKDTPSRTTQTPNNWCESDIPTEHISPKSSHAKLTRTPHSQRTFTTEYDTEDCTDVESGILGKAWTSLRERATTATIQRKISPPIDQGHMSPPVLPRKQSSPASSHITKDSNILQEIPRGHRTSPASSITSQHQPFSHSPNFSRPFSNKADREGEVWYDVDNDRYYASYAPVRKDSPTLPNHPLSPDEAVWLRGRSSLQQKPSKNGDSVDSRGGIWRDGASRTGYVESISEDREACVADIREEA